MNKTALWLIVSLCFAHAAEARMYDPFLKTAKHPAPSNLPLLPPPLMMPPPVPPMVVSAVMNNKAYINGAWYRIGDRVNNQEVAYIQNNFVGLKEGNRLTMIAVGRTRHVLSIKETP